MDENFLRPILGPLKKEVFWELGPLMRFMNKSLSGCGLQKEKDQKRRRSLSKRRGRRMRQ